MCAVVSSVQAESTRPGGDDGGARPVTGAYHHHAMGSTLHAGVRETLAPIRPCSRPVVVGDETYIKIKGEWCYLFVPLIGLVGQSTSG